MIRNRTSLLPQPKPSHLAKPTKARTRFDGIPASQQGYSRQGGGGLSFSNETSLGNPLYTQSPQLMNYYKKQNEQIVANDPYGHKRNINKNQGNSSGGMAGVMGGGGSGNGGGVGETYSGGNNGGNGGQGMRQGRGGVSFNV